jgi:hypothetical protein
MSILAVEITDARAQDVSITEDSLVVNLTDGRTISAPLAWYPRLWHGKAAERSNYEIIGDGAYIHWPDLDEDLSVSGILAGHRSGESLASLQQWLAAKQ